MLTLSLLRHRLLPLTRRQDLVSLLALMSSEIHLVEYAANHSTRRSIWWTVRDSNPQYAPQWGRPSAVSHSPLFGLPIRIRTRNNTFVECSDIQFHHREIIVGPLDTKVLTSSTVRDVNLTTGACSEIRTRTTLSLSEVHLPIVLRRHKTKHAPATSVCCPHCFRGVLGWKVSNLRAKMVPTVRVELTKSSRSKRDAFTNLTTRA